MKVKMDCIVNEYFQGKDGYLTVVDLENGGLVKITIPGSGDFKPGQKLTCDLVVKGRQGKFGQGLVFENGNFNKS